MRGVLLMRLEGVRTGAKGNKAAGHGSPSRRGPAFAGLNDPPPDKRKLGVPDAGGLREVGPIFATMNPLEDSDRVMIDSMPTMACTCRPDGFVEFVNRRWLEYTGLATEQALGRGWTA